MNALEKLHKNGVNIDIKDIYLIAKEYNIKELSIFGSSLRDDFNEESDVDFLIEFKESDKISLLDIVNIQLYFEKIINRKVDIVEPASLTNPFRRKSILDNREIIYAA